MPVDPPNPDGLREARAGRRNRGGRPHVADPKSSPITVRLTAAERALLDERAGPRGVGEYLRALVFNRRARLPRQVPAVNAAAWTALAPVVANLNQLARHANEGRVVDGDLLPVLDEMRSRVVALRAALLGRDDGDPDRAAGT